MQNGIFLPGFFCAAPRDGLPFRYFSTPTPLRFIPLKPNCVPTALPLDHDSLSGANVTLLVPSVTISMEGMTE